MSWEETSLFLSPEKSFPTFDDIYSANPDTNLYPKIFQFLKAQNTILKNLRDSINDKETNSMKNTFKDIINNILNSNYSTLFDSANLSIEQIENILKSDPPKEVSIFGYRIIKALTALQRVKALLSVSVSQSEKEQFQPNFKNKTPEPEELDQCCLCRICENYIPISQIESHVVACAAASESQKIVETLDMKIKKLIFNAKIRVLECTWPNESKTALGLILPVLHCTFLLEVLLGIDADSTTNATEKITMVYNGLEGLHITTPGHEVARDILMRAFGFCKEKLKAHATLESVISQEGFLPKTVSLSDFTFIALISKGAYARVFLARKNSSGDLFAVKVISRQKAAQKNTAYTEKNILVNFMSNNVVNLYYTLTGTNNLYLVMDYMAGGDLKNVLENVGCLPEDVAKIYLAQIVGALYDLRKAGIVHRDIKPDNVLIDRSGKIKLGDFGLSISGVVERIMDFAGTPDYVAPEIVRNKQHSFPADYWSLGVLFYELLTGVPPFHGDTPEETFMHICEGTFEPIDASYDAMNLIFSLLQPNPNERLGCNGVEDIMHHPFFNGINWEHLDDLPAPFIPELADDADTSYFGQCVLSEFADIQTDIDAQKKRSSSFGPEFLLKQMADLESYDYEEDSDELSSFASISTGLLYDSTIKQAMSKKGSDSFSPSLPQFGTSCPTSLYARMPKPPTIVPSSPIAQPSSVINGCIIPPPFELYPSTIKNTIKPKSYIRCYSGPISHSPNSSGSSPSIEIPNEI